MTVTLKQKPTIAGSEILAFGACRGSLSVPNEDIIGPIDSSDEWIQRRTGIKTRTRATVDVSTIDLAYGAAAEAIEKSGVAPSDIDLVIVATVTNELRTPSIAAIIADKLGAKGAAAYDSNAACAGYCYGIAQADAMIRAGQARYAVVVGAEKLSEIIDPADRSISFILGDGAGAAVLGPTDNPGVSASVMGSDGNWEAVGMQQTLTQFRDGECGWPTLRQEGPSVFRWAVFEMSKVAVEALEVAGVKPEELAAFIPHQANMRIIDEFAKQLGLPDSVVIAKDIAETGNTSAASVPLASHRLLQEHPELSGGLALQIGFGAGLVYAAQVVRLP